MRNKNHKKIYNIGIFLCLFAGFVTGMLILTNMNTVVEKDTAEKIPMKINKPVPLGDASLADGATKVMYIMHYKHQATPAVAYASNLSNASADCYEFYDYLNNELTGETPFGTAFDVAIKMAINVTHGYNTTSLAWENTLFNATLHGITGYGFTSDVDMVEIEIGTSGTWAYYHMILQDADGGAGNGFTIGQNVKTNATYEFWAYQ